MAETIYSVKNISRTYKVGNVRVKALRGFSFDINKGDFLVITGRNGSGKSTLLHQLGMIDYPDSGDMYFEKREIARMKEKHRRNIRLNEIGYIFQNYALIAELTALENVMLPAMMLDDTQTCRKRAIVLLNKVGLEKRLNHLTKQLSGGEQQKVAIARALINKPKVIFADEPTANLDTTAAEDVMKIFQKLNKEEGHTIIMVTHEPEETAYANREIRLSDGRLI